MTMIQMTRTKLYTYLFLLTAATVFGQQKQVQASIDSTKIKIGSQFNLTLTTTVDSSARVNFPEGKTFGRLEVLESYPVDTVKNGAMYELVKKYGLTQFDSGRYVIPPLPVTINNKSINTDSLTIEVANVAVDTVKQQMFDIKPVIAAKSGSRWWLWLLIAAALAAAGFGIWWYLKKRKLQPKAAPVVYATPIQKATAQLKSLEKKELLQRGEIKDYYSELTDIARTYIEEAVHIPAMESTTSELIDAMRVAVKRKKMKLSAETFEQLEKVLRNADMVKFAKSRPMDFEIDEDRSRIEKSIVVIDRSIPQEIEEDDDTKENELRKAAQLKKKKRQRAYRIAGGIGFVLLLIGVFIGGRYLRDNVLGRPTKELLEGEWVRSEYGEPPLRLETPHVLERERDPKVETNLPANIKSYQKFVYGSLADNFSIVVSSTAFKEPVKVDPEQAMNEEIAYYEKGANAKNIIMKTDEFSNDNGLSGRRAYGTMDIVDPASGKSLKMYYTIMLFIQDTSAKKVIVFHKEGDADAEKITERMLNSVELSKANQ
jgi:hypothetical protein